MWFSFFSFFSVFLFILLNCWLIIIFCDCQFYCQFFIIGINPYYLFSKRKSSSLNNSNNLLQEDNVFKLSHSHRAVFIYIDMRNSCFKEFISHGKASIIFYLFVNFSCLSPSPKMDGSNLSRMISTYCCFFDLSYNF